MGQPMKTTRNYLIFTYPYQAFTALHRLRIYISPRPQKLFSDIGFIFFRNW